MSLLSKTYPTPVPSNGELMHVIDIPHASRLVKTLVQGGHFDKKTSSISLAPSWSSSSSSAAAVSPRIAFIKAFVSEVDREDMVRMASSNGAFIIAELISATKELEDLKAEREVLKGYFDADAVKTIGSSRPKGMDLLLERVKAL